MSAEEFTFGRMTAGTQYMSLANRMLGTAFVAPKTGFLATLTADLSQILPGFKVKAAVYRASDRAFLGSSEELVGPIPAGRVPFNFPTTVPVVEGVAYYFVPWSNNPVQISFDINYSADTFGLEMTYGTFPATLDGAYAISWELSIYATCKTTLPSTVNLTIVQAVGGTTSPTPGVYQHSQGQIVQVTAIPTVGYEFVRWRIDGQDNGVENPINVIMDANHELQPLFQMVPPNYFTLTIESEPIQGVPFTLKKAGA